VNESLKLCSFCQLQGKMVKPQPGKSKEDKVKKAVSGGDDDDDESEIEQHDMEAGTAATAAIAGGDAAKSGSAGAANKENTTAPVTKDTAAVWWDYICVSQ